MSTIRIKRTEGSFTPSGLTFGEPAFVLGLKSLYIGQTAGDPAIRIGAEVSTDATFTSSSDNKIPSQLAVKTYIDNSVGGGAVSSLNGFTGAITIDAGTGIEINSTSKTISVLNTGVQSLTGTTNQISVSGATGAITLSLPSTVTVPGALNVTTNLTVTGNLTVNGTTTTVNSDVMTVDDPVIILGTSGGVPISVSDGNKDRGIAFNYYDTAGRTGFFGYDVSENEFVFQNRATISGDVTTGNSYANARIGPTLYLNAPSQPATSISGNPTLGGGAYTLPPYSGELVSSTGDPAADGYILKSNYSLGTASTPSWINPNAAGFTAFAATQLATARTIALSGNVTATGVAFNGTSGITLSTTIGNGVVTNAMLANSGITLGSTSISLGSTTTTLAGLLAVTATTFNGALNGNANTATALQTARTFSLTGNVTATGITFDGTGNVALNTTIGSGVVTNAMLVNSGFTLGSTNITLGSTGLTLAGLSSVTATTFTGSLSGTATTATNVTLTEATSANTSDLYPTFIASGATGGLLIDATLQAGLVALSYRPSTGTLTAYKLEGIVDGGSY